MKKLFQNMRLQSKITLTHMIIATVPILLLAVLFAGTLYDMIVSDTIRKEQESSADIIPVINAAINEVYLVEDELNDYLYAITDSLPDSQLNLNPLENGTVMELLEDKLSGLASIPNIQSIHFYLEGEDSGFYTDTLSSLFQPYSRIRGTYWHGIFAGSSVSSLLCPGFYLGPQEREDFGDLAYITKQSVTYHGGIRTLYTAVYFSEHYLDTLLQENITLNRSAAYLINERDSIAATSNTALSSTYLFDYATIQDSFQSSNNFIQRTILGETVYAGFYSIKNTDWYMVVVLPGNSLVERSLLLMFRIVAIYLGSMVFAFLLATFLAKSITRRISTVINQMQQVKKGLPVPLPPQSIHDEVGDLIDTYNYMTAKLNQLIQEQTQAAEDLRIAEFNSLQAQINPHFLYNTMDMINWLAQQGKTDQVTTAVRSLSRFYKLTLSRKNSISTIAQEIEHVTIYVDLQNMRFHHSIDFVVDIPDELMEYHIPKLTLQPVVENSILHGIQEKEDKSGTILITGWVENQNITLLISDDGVGIAPDILDKILTGEGESRTGTNIAVYNTHRRLQIFYGPEYGLSYFSEPGKGTEVQITIPAQKDEEVRPMANSSLSPKRTVPVIKVSELQDSPSVVLPGTLLFYNQKPSKETGTYHIQNIHQISEKLPTDENIYILAHEVTEDFPPHNHSYFEISYLLKGEVLNVIDGTEIYMAEGDMTILNRKAVQSLKYLHKDALLINLCLKPQFFEKTLKPFCEDHSLLSDFFQNRVSVRQNYLFFPLCHRSKAQSLLSSIIQEYANSGFHQTYALEADFLLFFDYLTELDEYSYYGTDQKAFRIIQYIRENCLTSSYQEIARHFGYQEDALSSYIKLQTGKSALSIIQEVRLEKAVHLLSDARINLYQIGEMCGFSSSDEFFQLFRKNYGFTPEEYRKQFF